MTDGPSYSYVLRGGTVLDGTGAPPVRADVGIVGERIHAVGDLSHVSSGSVVDVSGHFVCPGFIDIHTHSDISLLYAPGMESSLAQGVTTEVVGNCGFAIGLALPTDDFLLERRGLARAGLQMDWRDLRGFFRRIEDAGIAINVATLAGHGTLRKRVMGFAERAPDAAEMTAMLRDLHDAMEAGAVGLSTGLEYVPGMYANADELISLAKVLRQTGGFYATHLRDEGDTLEESVAEAIQVAETAGVPLQLSHHKAEKPQNWGKVVRTLQMVDAAEARGVDILLDQYPYTAYQTALSVIALPRWAYSGAQADVRDRLTDPGIRARIRAEMPVLDWRAIQITACAGHPEYCGVTISELARAQGKDARDFILDLLSQVEGYVSAIHFALSEEDVEYVLRDRRVMIGSDAVAASPANPEFMGRPHPRTYGTFARIFSRYVREKGVLTWEEAVRRMTSLPAARIGLSDRGRIAPGYIADLVALNPETIADSATFAQPNTLARGVACVFVAGHLAFAQGQATGVRKGRVLRR